MCAALQHGQSSPGALTVISVFAVCVAADAAATGTTTRLKASSAAKMERTMRITATLVLAARYSQFTALCVSEGGSLERQGTTLRQRQ